MKKILIVEDDKMLSTIFEMYLAELGYELVDVVNSGKAAETACSENKIDVILMDIHINGKIDGIETTKLIKEKFDIPVIFISSDVDEQTIKRAITNNTYGFLVKPVYKNNLRSTIEFAYEKHKFEKQLEQL